MGLGKKKHFWVNDYNFILMCFCGPFAFLPHNLHYGPRGSCVGYLTFIAPTKHLHGGLTFTVYNCGFLSQPTSNNSFHILPLFCFLSFLLSFTSATHLVPVWQPPQCTIESFWPEITLGKGRRSALQLCWRQWHNSNTNQGARFKTCTAALQPGWIENMDWICSVRKHL